MSGKFKVPTGPKKGAPEAPASQEQIEAFAAGAATAQPAAGVPWAGKRNNKGTEVFNLRLTEEQKARLDYIVANAGVRSAHAWIMSILEPAIIETSDRLYGERR